MIVMEGFRDTFTTPYEQYAEHKGKAFRVIGGMDHGPGVGLLYSICLEDNTRIEAWPEEIEVGWEFS